MADEFSKFGGIFPLERAGPADGGEPIVTSLEEFGQAHLAVEQALKYFNYAPLLERLHTARSLPLELSIAAGIIEGKIKKPRHRVAQPSVRMRKVYLALSVAEAMLKGTPRKAAISDVAEENDVSASTVSTAIRENMGWFDNLVSK
ncbi:MAG TPA: hypothetical protein VGJ76_06525 [Pseudolabrys sp.]|jgi:hypothetical protein